MQRRRSVHGEELFERLADRFVVRLFGADLRRRLAERAEIPLMPAGREQVLNRQMLPCDSLAAQYSRSCSARVPMNSHTI